MLRTNLSTRPFYNERGVHVLLGVVGTVVVALTIFNVAQLWVLNRRHADLGGAAAAAEARAATLRSEAANIRAAVNAKELETMSGAAREANEIIVSRLFSWTELLNVLETTLPDDVRITSLRPRLERDGTIDVAMTVVYRRPDDAEQFMTNLDATTSFTDVLSRSDMPNDDGTFQAVIEGRYLQVQAKR
jgi:Tfp pilus assembly protein PilN